MIDKKLDEIIERLERIEEFIQSLNPNIVRFEFKWDEGGNLIQKCMCGTSCRCYKCYPFGTMPEDFTSGSYFPTFPTSGYESNGQ